MDRKIEQTYNMKASPQDVWRALTDAKEIAEWSGANAYFIPQVGAMYTLWNGDISGRVIKVEPHTILCQTWMPKDWVRDDSVVTFTLTPTKEGTRVDLLHERVEAADYDGTNEGWDIYYLGAIKKMLEKRGKKSAPMKKAAATAKRSKGKKSKPKAKKSAAQKKKSR